MDQRRDDRPEPMGDASDVPEDSAGALADLYAALRELILEAWNVALPIDRERIARMHALVERFDAALVTLDVYAELGEEGEATSSLVERDAEYDGEEGKGRAWAAATYRGDLAELEAAIESGDGERTERALALMWRFGRMFAAIES